MEDYRLRPEQRVFHIDTECYVVYLGKDLEDYKPFLRIGTSRSLPSDVKSLILNIVVSDMFTGSPLEERDNLSTIFGDESRYIGDPDTVKRFKEFLRHMELPSEGFQEDGGDELEDQGVYVYFYEDGNIRLKFDKTEIFNLRRREERDNHYPQRVKNIKNHLVRNSLKIPLRELQTPGIVVREGAAYVFSRGNLGALLLSDNYFAELASCGVDPDRVTTFVTEDVSEGVFRIFKRARAKNDRIHVLSSNTQALKNTVELFKSNDALRLRSEVVKLTPGRFTPLLDFRVQRKGEQFIIERDGVPYTVIVSSEGGKTQAGQLRVNPRTGSWTCRLIEGGETEGTIADGVPTSFVELGQKSADLVGKYLPGKFRYLGDVFSAEEQTAVIQAMDFFNVTADGADPSNQTRALRQSVRSLSRPVSVLFWLFAHNAHALAQLAAEEHSSDSRRARAYASFAEVLSDVVTAAPRGVGLLSAVCDLHVGKAAVLPLYRLTENITRDKVEFSYRVSSEILSEATARDEAHFTDEQERLLDLIGQLDTTKARTRRPKKNAEATTAAAATAAADSTTSKERATSGQPAAAAAGRTGAGTGSSGRGSGQSQMPISGGRTDRAARVRKTRSRRQTGVIVAAVVALLVIVGLALFLFTDIPSRMAGSTGGESSQVASSNNPPGEQGAAAGETETGTGSVGNETGTERAPGETSAGGSSGAGNAANRNSEGGTAPGGSAAGGENPTAGGGENAGTESNGSTSGSTSETGGNKAVSDNGNGGAGIPGFEGGLPPGLEERRTENGIVITILDILRLANRIAVANGYRSIDSSHPTGPNPDWIYPGNVFELPDGTTHTVQRGDTLWGITADFIEKELNTRYKKFVSVTDGFDKMTATSDQRRRVVDQLRALKEETYSENFAALLEETIQEVSGN